MTTLRTAWRRATPPRLSVLRTEALSGLVVALALIPNAISFSIIAGVDPSVGLYAATILAIALAFLGGRPAMISTATPAMALVVAPLGREHGVDHLLAATVLAGVFQVVLGLAGAARLMRFVPTSVITGFVNALGVMIFTAQIPYFAGDGWPVYAMIAAGLAVIWLLPKLTRAVPAPLAAIALLTAVAWTTGLNLPTVGDMGRLPDSLPVPFLPDVPLTAETLATIGPTALTLALVGLIESLITAKLVDDYTETGSDKAREARGQGWANILSGFFGGMPGCATVGPTVMNVRSGARTRLSLLFAGVFLIVLVTVLDGLVTVIPMAALVAVMVYVAATTIDWRSLSPRTVRRLPWSETAVMLVTAVIIVATHNMALGVAIGVVASMVLFARNAAVVAEVTSVLDPEGGTRVYSVYGELFFGSREQVLHHFDFTEPGVHAVTIDLSGAHVWDASAVAALDRALERFRKNGVEAEITGLNESSAALHNNVSGLMAEAK